MESAPRKESVIDYVDVEKKIQAAAIVGLKPSKDQHTKDPVKNEQAIAGNSKLNCENEKTCLQNNNVKNVCRICLLDHCNMVSLMSKIGSNIIADMFYSVTAVEVVPEENLPLTVCSPCRNNLIDCYGFKMKCIESNNILLSNSNINEKQNKDSCIAGKIDKETQTCDDIESNIHSEDKNTVNIKVEMDFKNEHEYEEVEYLEQDFFLTNESEKDIDRMPKNLLTERKIKKRQFSCLTCPKKFLKLKALRVHAEVCSENKKNEFKCSQCTQSFTSAYDLKIHSALHVKENKWKCIECKKEFTDRTRFRRHIRRHMAASKRWGCAVCGKAFSEQSALRRHARVHTGQAAEKKYHCQMCDKRFGDRNQLTEHSAKHTGVRPCSCEQCGQRFASARLLASHRRVHSEHRPHQCDFCGKRFREKSTRDTHHRTHTGERPYICSVCGKAFIQSSNLCLHMRTHTGEKPYTCEVCGRKFSAGSTLACHMRIHTGEKPYSCTFCGKRFARTDIRTHVRLHTGERPHACCACPKQFVSASALREHRRVHTGEKPYQCTFCPAKYKKKMYLINHLKAHTKDKKLKNKNIMEQTPYMLDDNVIYTKDTEVEKPARGAQATESTDENKNASLNAVEIPLEVSQELILLDDSDVKTELVVVDDGQNNVNYQNSSDICLNEVIVEDDLNINDVHVVTEDESEINLSEAIHEGATVKLYQLDESLLHIQASGGQVTIRKITSQMTTNF